MKRINGIGICFILCYVIIISISSGCSVHFSIDDGTFQIVSFTASSVYLKKGKSTILTVTVDNPNNYTLSYTYQVLNGGGSITGIGPIVTYKATNIATNAEIRVVVTNTRGQGFTNTVNITVIEPFQKISDTEGNFTGILDNSDFFGNSVANIGDLNNDGVQDIVVGSYDDGDGGSDRGAIWILFLNIDGTVKAHQKISDTQGNFTGTLDDNDSFGSSVTSLGDLDGDGVKDIAVGAYRDADGGSGRGAVWILFMNSDGTVKAHQKISDTQGNFTGTLDDSDYFGSSVTSLGDLDGDGVKDIAVGAEGDNDGGLSRGAIWILFLNIDGTVKAHQKISDTEGNFTGILDNSDYFGSSVTFLGDLDGDGVKDIAVGAYGDADGGSGRGAVWILFMNSDGTVGN